MSSRSAPHSREALDVVAVLAQRPESGGGFHQSLNSLATLATACHGRHRLTAVVLRGGLPDPEDLGRLVPALSEVTWLPAPVADPGRGMRSTLRRRSALKPDRAAFLDGLGADLVFFLSPSPLALGLRRTPFAMTVWDVCHLDFPEFPEVRANGEFEAREQLLARTLPLAVLVVTDSEALSDRIHDRYGVDRSRLLAQPFAPSPYLVADPVPTEQVIELYDLKPGYWFYPAQFWAHKNHVRVLEALAILGDAGVSQKAVFAGGDKGFRAVVEAHARSLGVIDDVRFLGFVPSEHLRGLYEASVGLVFPSYFGPTNLPPLEAIALGVPVVCSDFHERTLGEGPLYFDPDDAEQLADRMLTLVRSRGDRGSHLQERTGVGAPLSEVEVEAVDLLRNSLRTLAMRLSMLRPPEDDD